MIGQLAEDVATKLMAMQMLSAILAEGSASDRRKRCSTAQVG